MAAHLASPVDLDAELDEGECRHCGEAIERNTPTHAGWAHVNPPDWS